MRNAALVFFVFAGLGILLIGFSGVKNGDTDTAPDYLRIHIRANSNSEIDQDIKYKVKEEIVNALSPILAGITTKQAAISAINKNIPLIEETANRALQANGFEYKSYASIARENFPERIYDGVTVAAGVYDALIINLGSGAGDNWWCVIYPPLCFTENTINGDEGVIYKSKIKEIIQKYFNK
jgi:stage II sporulation protein R